MPEFANPLFLLTGMAVPLVLWRWLRCRGAALRFPAAGIFTRLPAGRANWARWGGAVLRAAALICLILALAGMRWPDLHTRVETEGIAITMVVDVSGSMAEPDFVWQDERVTRLDAVKRAFTLFLQGGEGPGGEVLDGRPNDLASLVTFATRPESSCPLTLSHSVLLGMLEAEDPRRLPDEAQTNIGDAIVWGLRQLEPAGSRRKVMVLLSDGEHNVPEPAWKPRQAAQLAAGLHVPIYAIDAGGDSSTREEDAAHSAQTRLQGEKSLQAVAEISGGRYFRAQDTSALVAVYQEVDRLERQPIQSFRYRRYYEGYPWLGLIAFSLLIGVRVLERTVWLRVP